MKIRLLAVLLVTLCAASTASALLWIVPARFAAPSGGGGGWTPASLTNLKLWLQADGNVYTSGTTQATDGQTVATWVDASSAGNNATEATNKPTFKTNIVNGKPVVRFAGSPEKMTISDNSSLEMDGSLTIVAAFSLSSSGALISKGADAASAGAINYQVGNPIKIDRPYVAGGTDATTPNSTSTWYVVTLVVSGTSVSHYLNGVANGTSTLVAGTAGNNPIRICHFNNGSDTSFLTADVFAIVATSDALGTTDRQALEDYIGAKVGVTITH